MPLIRFQIYAITPKTSIIFKWRRAAGISGPDLVLVLANAPLCSPHFGREVNFGGLGIVAGREVPFLLQLDDMRRQVREREFVGHGCE